MRAAIAAGHPESARAGAEALAGGGSAVDAAIAAALAAAVAESALTGPGAGGFLLAAMPGSEPVLLDFFVAAPGLAPGAEPLDPATLEAFTVPFGDAEQVFHIGPASVAVPGQLPGLIAAHERFGRLPFADLVAPAIRLARAGVRLEPEVAFLHRILGEMLCHTEGAREVYAPGGRLLDEGDLLRMPRFAETLAAVAADPAGAWATLGSEIVSGLGPHGRITAEDLAAYEVIERAPLRAPFRGGEVLTNPPPSWGGVLIAAALGELTSQPPPQNARERAFGLVRAGTAANALRGPDFAEQIANPEALAAMLAGPGRAPAGTTHISAIDADGGAAALSSSNGAGSGVIVGDTGFLLNNMMGEHDLNPEGFGRVPHGARPPSMMSPTIMLRDGRPVLALGSAGSNRIRSAILAVMSNLVDAGMAPAEAVAAPRLHPEGGEVDVEAGAAEEVVSALVDAGYRLRRWTTTSLFFGGAAAVTTGEDGPAAAADPRRGGAAFGVTAAGEVRAL